MRQSPLTRLAPRGSGRSRHAQEVYAAWEKSAADAKQAADKLEGHKSRHAQLERERADLVRARLTYDTLRERIRLLGDSLFDDDTCTLFPVLTALRWEAQVQAGLDKLIPAEIAREKRARQTLKTAQWNIEQCLKFLREALQKCIDIGVPQNKKHHLRLFSGGTLTVTRQIIPFLMNTKTCAGDFFAKMAQSRLRQPMVHRPPTFELIDLSSLPGRAKSKPVDEKDLYTSLETSYVQCQQCRMFVVHEIRTSFAREKEMRLRQTEIGAQIERANEDVRAAQHAVLMGLDAGTIQSANAELERIYGAKLAQLASSDAKAVDEPTDEELAVAMQASTVKESSHPTHLQELIGKDALVAELFDEEEVEPAPFEPAPSSTIPPYASSDAGSSKTKAASSHVPVIGMSMELYHATSARLRTLLADVDAQTRVEEEEEDLPWHHVTLFAARPVSSRLKSGGQWVWYESTEGGHGATSWGRMQAMLTNATRRGDGARNSETDIVQENAPDGTPVPWWQERRFPFLFPPPQFPLNLPPPVRLASIPWLQRWRWRWHDLSQLGAQMEQDKFDTETFPELDWDAKVRCSPDLHPEEEAFIAKRRHLMSSEGDNSLAKFLQLPEDTYVHPDDVPLIAIGGSGGGYRAMYSYAGFIKEAENTGLWQCTTWASGVSGSCWTLAAYYTIASCSTDVLIAHLLAMAHEQAHPMSVQAMDRIARSRCGVYYLLGPLLRKSQNRSISCRIMDFYATLVLSYQFLPRPLSLFGTDFSYNGPQPQRAATLDASAPPGVDYEPSEGLSRKSFQWSKVWERASLNDAKAPLPILTGVRRVWRPRPKKPRGDPSVPAGSAPPEPHPAAVSNETTQPEAYEHQTPVGGGYDWYEISPLELGSRNVGAWIPTWSYGRRFENGESTQRQPEIMLSMVVGQCTGAPAGPMTAYISTMLASIPQGTVMSSMLSWVNEFVKMKRWEKRWGNPIRAADEPNPFYGHGMDDRVVPIPPEAQEPLMKEGPSPAEIPALRRPTSVVDEPYVDNRLTAAGEIPVEQTGEKTPKPAPALFMPRDATNQMLADPVTAPVPATLAQPAPEKGVDGGVPDVSEQFVDAPDPANDSYMNAFFSKLPQVQMPHMPKLPDITIENPLRLQRRRSDASITSSMSDFDPETFMAPMQPPHVAGGAESSDESPARHAWSWEHSKRLRLMDSGLSNNLPNHVLARDERHADVIISFDSSSDVKTGAAVERLHEFAGDCGLEIKMHSSTQADLEAANKATADNEAHEEAVANGHSPSPDVSTAVQEEAERIRAEYEPKSAQRFDGWRMRNGGTDGRDPDVHMIYCPLFPNAVQPGFDPTTAHYSTSYNLIWTADQVRALLRTAMANVEEGSYGIQVIRAAVRDAYESRRAARLAREACT